MKKLLFVITLIVIMSLVATTAFASAAEQGAETETEQVTVETATDMTKSHKAYAAGICVALAAFAGALGMALAICKSNESIARQPEAEGSIKSNMMLGLVFIETAIIYALIVAILIIFVL